MAEKQERDILMSFKRPKWPIRSNERLHLKCWLVFEKHDPNCNMKHKECIHTQSSNINIQRKKRAFFAKVETHTCNLVLSEDRKESWKMFHEMITYHASHFTRVLACGCNVVRFIRTAYCSISTGHISSVVHIF